MNDEQIKAVAALRLEGVKYDQIAQQLGTTRNMVSKRIRQARDAGLLPEHAPKDDRNARMTYMKDSYNLRSGALFTELCQLPREQFEWLLDEASDNGCATVAEYVRQMVSYVYEVEQRQGE